MPNTGYLGGNASFNERRRLLKKYILDKPAVDKGMRSQCRCGNTVYTLWRKRWHCRRCGAWIRKFHWEQWEEYRAK